MRNRAFKPATSACGSYGINEPLCLPAASGRLRALPLAALMESTRRFVCLQRSGDFAPYRLRLLYVSDQRERGFLSARQREPGVRRRTANRQRRRRRRWTSSAMLTTENALGIIYARGESIQSVQEGVELAKEQEEFQIELYKDLIFRAIFGDDSVKNVLKCLLNAVLSQAELPLIAELELGSPFKAPSFYDGKFSIMDLHAIDETGRHFDIEMQLQPQTFFGDRLFYYGAGLFGTSLQQGKGYTDLPKVVCVAFINFPLDSQKPDVWFDKWQMRSTLGTGLGTDKVTSIFVRLPRVFEEEQLPPGKFSGQLFHWVRVLSSYSKLTAKEKRELARSTEGFAELERRITGYFSTEEGRKVIYAQREFDSWIKDLQREQENRIEEEHKARVEAERGREEERRGREEAERRGEEDRLLYIERQKKMIVRLFKRQFGAEAALPENWAEGRSADDLDVLADKIDECATLEEALAVLEK